GPRACDAAPDEHDGRDPTRGPADFGCVDALEKVVPCGMAEEVWVEQGQELHGRLAWRPRDVVEVGDGRVQPRAVERARCQLLREARPGRVAEAGPGSPPAREI